MTRHCETVNVITLGKPKNSTPEIVKDMYKGGADIFRINFSHGAAEEHAQKVAIIRALEKENGAPIPIIGDLQGPKLRIGEFKSEEIKLQPGMRLRFDSDQTPGDESRVYLPHPEIVNTVKEGSAILLDDGKVGMTVTATGQGWFEAAVDYGSALSDHKGIGVRNTALPFVVPTEKDKKDLRIGLRLGIRNFVESFIQSLDDIKRMEQEIETAKAELGIAEPVALTLKMETLGAMQNFEEILAYAKEKNYMMMLGRGDLGMAIDRKQIPLVQEYFIDRTREECVKCILATHIQESTQKSPITTRAEDSDAARGVLRHVYALMLSAETAAGDFPVESVRELDDTCARVEQWRLPESELKPQIRADFFRSVFGSSPAPRAEPLSPSASPVFRPPNPPPR